MNATLKDFLTMIDPQAIENAANSTDSIQSPDALKRSHAMTVAMLQHAHALINEAESKLQEQEKRIKSLENLAVTDELTGLLNRRGFENAVKRELERLQRKQLKGGAFCLLDLDEFKPINDTYGHQAGDLCLEAVGECLKQLTRTTDVAARMGGDEFALYIANINEGQAHQKINEINEALNNLTIEWKGKTISVKASLGFIMVSYPAKPYAEIYDDADQHMYKIKTSRKGRKTQRQKILSETNI
jgi:diguanylate cyclase (GGDEF)-like protein